MEQKDGTMVVDKLPFEHTETVQPEARKEPAVPPDEPKTRDRRGNRELLDLIVACGDNASTYARQVVENELDRDIFAQDWALAKVLQRSGQFEDLAKLTEDQAISTAMVKIRLGRSWGIDAADAMRFIYFTNGKPAIETELFAKALDKAGFNWDVAYDYDEKTRKCIGATIFPQRLNRKTGEYEPITMKRRNKNDGWDSVQLEVSFTKEEADAAMIWEKGKQIPLSEKWNFRSWAEDMYFWRALSRFRKRHAPNVLSGAMTRDEAEEMEAAPKTARPLFEKKEDAA